MTNFYLFVALVLAAIIGGLIEYLLGLILPKKPGSRHVITIILTILVFGIIATLFSSNGNNEQQSQEMVDVTPLIIPTSVTPTLVAPTPIIAKPTLPITDLPLSPDLALRLLYGNEIETQTTFDDKYTYALRSLNALESQVYDFDKHGYGFTEGDVYSKVIGMISLPYDLHPYGRYLVLIETAPKENGGHASAPAISGAIFTYVNGAWEVEENEEAVSHIGNRDEVPPSEFSYFGPGKPVVVFESKDDQMGYEWKNVYMLAYVEYFGIREIFNLRTYWANTQSFECMEDGKCYEYDSTVEFIWDDQADYYDIQVQRWGTDLRDETVVPIQETEIYQLEYGEYQLVGEQ